MYDPVYGNHIGVVINNLDPENRGRLQIFIPHLSNNLLPTWNTNLKDISFKSAEVNAKLGSVLERLKNTLPWAETAVPSFGGGTAGPVKYDGNSSPLPLVPNAAGMQINAKKVSSLNFDKGGNDQSVNRTDYPNSLSEVPDNVLRYLAGIAATESGAFTNNSYDRILKEAYDPKITLQYSKNSDLEDIGFLQINKNYDINVKFKGLNIKNQGPLSDQLVSGAKMLKSMSSKGYELLEQGKFDEANAIANYTGPRTEKYFWHGPHDNEAVAKNAMNQDPQKLRDYINAFDSDPDNLRKQNELLAGNSIGNDKKSSPVQMTDSLAAEGGVGSPSGEGAAAGFFSKPAIGAKVWVFFYGGDVQRPVYFASVMEPKNYEVANQTVASS